MWGCSLSKPWKVTSNRKNVDARLKRGTSRGLNIAGEHISGVSKEQTPIEEGDLRRSHQVSVEGMEAAVSVDTPYAVVVHEDMSARHPEGNAKFLENAFNSEADNAAEIIAREVRGEL